MKKIISLALFNFFFWNLNAQVSIGSTTPDASAVLDLNVNTIMPKKGFLLPRLNLTGNNDVSTVPNPANGLLTYNYTTANSGNNQIKGQSTHYFDGSKWQHFTHIDEVKNLKLPVEFVITSKLQQILTPTELTQANSNSIVVVKWELDDIFVENEDDMELNEVSDELIIKTASYYDFSGMINFRAVTSTSQLSTHVILVLQKLSPDGEDWEDIMATSAPMEQNASSRVYTLTMPNFIHYLNENDRLRLAFKKPNYLTANNFTGNSGIAVANVLVDVTKSLRIVRIDQ